jgi:hypothetical protein
MRAKPGLVLGGVLVGHGGMVLAAVDEELAF